MTLILLLSIIGIVAILAELVLPGGILGVIGIGLLVAAVVVTFAKFGATAGIVASVLLLIFCFVVLGWWMKYFHRLPLTRKLILQNESGEEDEKKEERNSLLGKSGTTLTDLMPSGRVKIDGQKIDVIAESGSIGVGVDVTVVAVRGPSIVVRAK
ncbi:MAG: NfeD family protein [Verrucomicrobiales bacterium]|nr:NfeD family protein [Verrucomicrobiales bacterium]